LVRENLVVETIGKNFQKIIENLGSKDVNLSEFWSTKIWGREFVDFKGNSENANMLCNLMHF
jgi:hypothetical protein